MLQQQAPIESARAALDDARTLRARHLHAVTIGAARAVDVITAAQSSAGVPLRQIKLRQLVLAQPSVGKKKADAFLSAVAGTLEAPVGIDDKTIGWLIDSRAGGRRILSWLDAATTSATPWPGFPFSPSPHPEDPQP